MKNILTKLSPYLNAEGIARIIFVNKRKFITPILLLAVLAFAFYLRMNTFWLSHWKGDQSHYICLALKL